jgi:DNA-binding NarL/FixJ family response regulator
LSLREKDFAKLNHSVERPTIVVADDHAVMLAEVVAILKLHCDIVAAVENGTLAVRAVSTHRPDVAVLDIAMPELSGIEAAQLLTRMKSLTKVIFITVQADPDYIQAAEVLGAGFVLKSRIRTDLFPAIEKALGQRSGSPAE